MRKYLEVISTFMAAIIIIFAIYILIGLFNNSSLGEWLPFPISTFGKLYEKNYEYLSIGEEKLFLFNKKKIQEAEKAKDNGIDFFKYGKYEDAYKEFKKSFDLGKDKDPETLIYFNNACVESKRDPDVPIYTIAAVVNTKPNKMDSARQMLQGIAQAQTKINGNLTYEKEGNLTYEKEKVSLSCNSSQNEISIKILIADEASSKIEAQKPDVVDEDEKQNIKKIAKILGKHPKLLAAVGYSTSDFAEEVVEIYNNNKLVLMLPVSTKTDLTIRHEFVFRTISDNNVIAMSLEKFIRNNESRPSDLDKAVVFYNPKSGYSSDIADEFKKAYKNEKCDNILNCDPNAKEGEQLQYFLKQGEKDLDINLSSSTYSLELEDIITLADTKNVKVFVFFPSSEQEDDISKENTVKLIKTINSYPSETKDNSSRIILTGDSFYNYIYNSAKLIPETSEASLVKIVLALPWHTCNLDDKQKALYNDSKKLWGGDIGWRAALSYDSIIALSEALKGLKEPSKSNIFDQFIVSKLTLNMRQKLQDKLLNMNESSLPQGFTGEISFSKETGERKERENIVELVSLTPKSNDRESNTSYKYDVQCRKFE